MNEDWTAEPLVLNFEHLARSDVGLVGGKNSSLGEMIRALGPKGIPVPPGFTITSYAYWHYVDANNIRSKIDKLVNKWQAGQQTLAEAGLRSNIGGSGIMFSIDTESRFDKVVLINAAWGLSENVIQGTVNPDKYQAFKPLLSNKNLLLILSKKLGDKLLKIVYGDKIRPIRNIPTSRGEQAAYVLEDKEILQLSQWACLIKEHYSCLIDME
ncbi:pyruvate, water dikinase [Fusarium oxysporum f. sp. vasinfectum 25433]|uniref:pyruvate, water dikinase n=1 Tax=Fusarium oxysporum f. sp. vasinfectum 25433 TaxID=1089449 RepID=X0KWV4_FUSOX|nr:pyruvate, water dikinase [Fusarium oxysporum f. sp. vasinfectum 25433]